MNEMSGGHESLELMRVTSSVERGTRRDSWREKHTLVTGGVTCEAAGDSKSLTCGHELLSEVWITESACCRYLERISL
jgi:hypothetical protein